MAARCHLLAGNSPREEDSSPAIRVRSALQVALAALPGSCPFEPRELLRQGIRPSWRPTRIDPYQIPVHEMNAGLSAWRLKTLPRTFLAAMWQWQIQSRVLRQTLSGPI